MSSTIALGDIVNLRKGRKAQEVLSAAAAGALPYIQIDEVRGVAPTKYAKDPCAVDVGPDDLCIVWDGANAGTVGYGLRGAIGSTVARIRFSDRGQWDAAFIGRLLQGKFRQLNDQAQARGATIPHVDKSKLEQLVIPRIDLDEQRRIAAILDKADAIRRKREQALALADDLLKSTFLEMFGDPVINDKNWPRKPLSELLFRIDSGQSPRCEARAATPHEYGILKVSAVSSTRFRPGENKAVKDGFVPRKEHLVKKGDLLFSRKNTYELVGATAIVEQEVGQLAMPDLIFRLVPNLDVVTSEFLWSALTQPNVREAMRRQAGGAAASMPNIGKQKLLGLEIACPPPEAQRHFSRVFVQVREAHAKQAEAMHAATELFASLSQRAFRGEL
jgi:type I restriction enzyme, S subunit